MNWIERHAALVFVLFSAVLVPTLVAQAMDKPFGHDEIITVMVARLPSLGAVWRSHLDGVDSQPPLNSVVSYAVRAAFGSGPVLMRLPPIFGYWLMSLCVFELVRRRSNVVTGLAAGLLGFFTMAGYYATEARSYGVMLGLFAVALLAWTEAVAGRRRVLWLPVLSVALGAGLWTSYFAAVGFVPVVVGETIRLARTGRSDWPLWLAVLGAASFVLPLLPLVEAARSDAATYWRHAVPADLVTSYGFLLGLLPQRRFQVLAAIVGTVMLTAIGRHTTRRAERVLPPHELAAGVAALLIAPLGVALALTVTGAFHPRYVIIGVVGLVIAIPYAAWRLGPSTGAAERTLCAGLTALFLFTSAQTIGAAASVPRGPVADRSALASALAGTQPVAVTGTLYLRAWYYAPDNLRRRLVYVASPDAALDLDGTNTVDRLYLALQRWIPIDVQDYDTFVSTHQAFVVYSLGTFAWLPRKLSADGFPVVEIGREDDAVIYQVGPAGGPRS